MPALVLIVPFLAMVWDQGLYPHRRPHVIIEPPAITHWIALERPYQESITLVTGVTR